jgi:hypothetical protein
MTQRRTINLVGDHRLSDYTDSEPIYCPDTGDPCEGELSYLCDNYGCARKSSIAAFKRKPLKL